MPMMIPAMLPSSKGGLVTPTLKSDPPPRFVVVDDVVLVVDVVVVVTVLVVDCLLYTSDAADE